VVAPVVYLLLLGLPGIVLYKAINTADSMIGHRTERHAEFGRASAVADDWANLLPARLAAGLIALAALVLPGFDGPNAWRAARRDAPRHASPNAGWPEAAMAGALGISLGGPRAYGGKTMDLAPMGDGRRDLGAPDITRALVLYRAADGLLLLVVAALAALALALR
jgi:adenosylcobinamide-phosphate synthase